MKKIYTLLLSFSITISSIAQSHLQWTTPEITPGSQVNLFKGTATDKSGITYTINFTQDPNNHYFTYRFFSYSTNGAKLWQYDNDSCFTNCMDKYEIIVPVDDDGALFVGDFNDLSSAWQVRIKHIGLLGSLIWQTNWTGPYEYATPVLARLDHAGNLIVALKAYITVPQQEDFALAKFDHTTGNLIWHFEIPDGGTGSASLSEIINAMDFDAADNIYCSGHAGLDNCYFKVSAAGSLDYKFAIHDNDSASIFLNSSGVKNVHLGNNNDLYLLIGAGSKTWVQKYDALTGSYLFTKKIQHDSATTVPVDFFTDNNEVYVQSNYNYFIPDTTFAGGHFTNVDYMITKLDANGNTVWEKSFLENLDSLSLQNGFGGAAQMGICDGHIFALSSAAFDSAGDYQCSVLTKMDKAGNIAWYDTTQEHFGPGAFAMDTSCNVYLTRSKRLDNYVAVVTKKFSEVTAGVPVIDSNSFNFYIYPNPANKEINFFLSENTVFEIELMNTLGETILKEKNKNRLDVSSLPDGIYFLRLCQGTNFYTRKLVIQ